MSHSSSLCQFGVKRLCTWGVGAKLSLLVMSIAGGVVRADSLKPNFLILLADDLRSDCLSCAGHPVLKTPNIDALAADGVRFSNAFVTTSICCISRASYLTGKYASNHKVGDFTTALSADDLSQSYPMRLRQAGYRLGCFGKWGIGGKLPKDQFDAWNAWSDQGKYFKQIDGEEVHNSEFLARWSSEFLKSQPKDKPFCLSVLFKAPHDPMEPDPRDAKLYAEVQFPMPASGQPDQFAKLPEFLRQSLGVQRAHDDIPTDERRQEYTRNYLRLVAGLDRAVGKILATLDDLGMSKDTVVVFASDNGYMLGEHGMVHKWLMYEDSIRVPIIVRYPAGIPKSVVGKMQDAIALNVDLAPTLMEFAGLSPAPSMDGKSLVPLLKGGSAAKSTWRTEFFYEHHYNHNGTIPRTEGLWTPRWKFVRYFDANVAFEQLFDLQTDRLEMNNLAGDLEHRSQLDAIKRQFELARKVVHRANDF